MTAREYFALPEPTGGFLWELHFGELVRKDLPTKRAWNLKQLIRDLLAKKLGRSWVVGMELPYGLTLGNDVRAADVGVVPRKIWEAHPDADCLIGSPDIVVQLAEEQDVLLHIIHGASAVWLVKPERREVVAVTASSRQVCTAVQTIPLPGSASIGVSDIFPA